MMINKIIVTGGLGFIGKNFCEAVSEYFSEKIILDKFTYASDLEFYERTLRPAGWELIPCDIASEKMKGLGNLLDNALVINLAAESHVDNSFSNATAFLKANTLGTLQLVEQCIRSECKLLHVSTDEVYGEITTNKVDEESVLNPTNPYSATKAAADILVQTYIKCFQLDAKIIRANNVFGRRQLTEKVIPKAIHLAHSKKPFFMHGSKDLHRHFLHTDDFASAIIAIYKNWTTSEHRIFNIAGDEQVNIRELVSYIYQRCQADKNLIKVGGDRPFNDAAYMICDKRLRRLGWKPKVDFWCALDELCDTKSVFKLSRQI